MLVTKYERVMLAVWIAWGPLACAGGDPSTRAVGGEQDRSQNGGSAVDTEIADRHDVGSAYLELAADAKAAPGIVRVTTIKNDSKAGLASPPPGAQSASDLIFVGPTETRFAAPAALTVKIESKEQLGADEEFSLAVLSSPKDKIWQPVPMAAVKESAAAATIHGGGIYGVFRHHRGRLGALGKRPGWIASHAFANGMHFRTGFGGFPHWGRHGGNSHGSHGHSDAGTVLPVCLEGQTENCRCAKGFSDCDPSDYRVMCIDTQNSDYACGACGHACDTGFSCKAGECKALNCPEGRAMCGSECVDIQSDWWQCGGCKVGLSSKDYAQPIACRNRYDEGGTVLDCVCPPAPNEMSTPCDTLCVDVKDDSHNCGACNVECGNGEWCENGTCVKACPDGQTLVEESNSYSIWQQCLTTPAVGVSCSGSGEGTESSCVDGRCVCADGLTLCDELETSGSFKFCADLKNDASHCGQCNHPCPYGLGCIEGQCVASSCPEGQILCRNTCVDPKTQSNACGGCTGYYPVPMTPGGEARVWDNDTGTAEADCSSGVCVCDPWVAPAHFCRDRGRAYCADFSADRDNCGTCGTTCKFDERCSDGRCVPECDEGFVFDYAGTVIDNLRGSCLNGSVVGDVCPATGGACDNGTCRCDTGRDVCPDPEFGGTECVDLSKDNENCGRCGNRCAMGTNCLAGTC